MGSLPLEAQSPPSLAKKLVKLVEAQNVDRPIPLVAFVARQRDLRKLIGDTVPGAQKLNFDDSVDWSEGRFGVIKLEDRNLPLIANRRVLTTKSTAARQELDDSFEQTAKIRKEVMDTLSSTIGVIRAQVRAIRKQAPGAKVFGILAPGR